MAAGGIRDLPGVLGVRGGAHVRHLLVHLVFREVVRVCGGCNRVLVVAFAEVPSRFFTGESSFEIFKKFARTVCNTLFSNEKQFRALMFSTLTLSIHP